MKIKVFLLAVLSLFINFNNQAQKKKKSEAGKSYPEEFYGGLEWRNIGPFRGGRSAAVTGVPGKPNLYYFGSTGGGVWRTTDAGSTFENISDGYFGGSIGAVAVSDWDPNVIYVGGGEKTVRGNVSYGYGMWKSVDAGKTWSEIGLKNSRHIPRIKIHPKNPDLVYAAVLGDLFKPTSERGIYRSKDGGQSWEQVLFVNENAGFVDLVLDPANPRILYASSWRIRRTPYSLESGGEGSAIWKSTDGGDTWTNISKNEGLPGGIWGISGITVSPVNNERVWALIENQNGGVYRSDDGGKTWKKTNSSRSLRQRAWYYTRIYADTQDEDKVYVLNVNYHVSTDGGRTFESSNAPHGDHHDLWIDPENNERMIIGDDGGAQISFDAGENWSTYHNQPTSQFYRVVTDNAFPYRIYGAQQDNSTVRIAHRTSGRFIGESDWESTAGGESAHIAVDPTNDEIVYGGSYDGYLTRYNHDTEEIQAVNVWPDNPMGWGAEGMKYRFQWNFPIFFSPHNPKKIYTASNHLHASTNGGQSWDLISPDLTTNDTTKLGSSGGPITKDNTSVEYYCTIFAAAESQHEEGVIYTGSDDGLIHITKDGGKNWKNITPPGMPKWTMINSIEIDPFNKGGMLFAGTRYKFGDYQPYLYKTSDYGATWTKITTGIANDHFTRVLRADPERQGLLYAGTETGMYISFDSGLSWKPFQMNLPIVPITDLTIKNNNLIAATQGRGFWIIDDLTPLHQLNDQVVQSSAYLFKPMETYRMGGGNGRTSKTAGTNHPGGVLTYFFLKDTAAVDTVSLSYKEANGSVIKTFSNYPDKKKDEEKLEFKQGMNMFNWDMIYPDAKTFDGMILWWSNTSGPTAVPGEYTIDLTVNGETSTQSFTLIKDPRSSASQEDLQKQFDFLIEVRDKLTETHEAITNIRKAKSKINDVTKSLDAEEYKELKDKTKDVVKRMSDIEKALYQTKNESRQDPLNFPVRLNNKLGHLAALTSYGDNAPTEQSYAFKDEVIANIDAQLSELYKIFNEEITEINQLIIDNKIQLIELDE
ncbi:VPS10 domain-containing protein [Marinoscillum pacificum]|uniref:VPS10 domain-containing protein n=1 Tax=Marinoscillum pacificum TaxID=392723 RepID=UPI0021578C99|nr:glycosyl hydrolase [Marinoscillum pacificum]